MVTMGQRLVRGVMWRLPVWNTLWRLGFTPPITPTGPFKRRIIAGYADGLDTFIETGTFRGDTVEAMRTRVREVYSIELAPHLAAAARARFADYSNVRILEGDSADLLPTILPDGPALFWLDGHWSIDRETARGAIDTPLLMELRHLLARKERDVILIDDAHLLGTGDYSSLETVRELVGRASPPRTLTVAYDIARIVPRWLNVPHRSGPERSPGCLARPERD